VLITQLYIVLVLVTEHNPEGCERFLLHASS